MGKSGEKSLCPPNAPLWGGSSPTLPPQSKSRGYAPGGLVGAGGCWEVTGDAWRRYKRCIEALRDVRRCQEIFRAAGRCQEGDESRLG